MEQRRTLAIVLLIISYLAILAVLRYPPSKVLPADPLGLLVVDGTCAPGERAGAWALPLGTMRLRLVAPWWSLLTGHAALWLAVPLLSLCLLPLSWLLRSGKRELLATMAAIPAWTAALVLQPLTLPALVLPVVATSGGERRRLLAAVVGSLVAVVLVSIGRPADVLPVARGGPGPVCRRVVAAWWMAEQPWGGLVRLGGASRAASVLGELSEMQPASFDLRLAWAEALVISGQDAAAAVHLDILGRQRPDDTSLRLAEAWFLLLSGRPGGALRRFRALSPDLGAPALAGEYCALRLLGRKEATAVRRRLAVALGNDCRGRTLLALLPAADAPQSSPR